MCNREVDTIYENSTFEEVFAVLLPKKSNDENLKKPKSKAFSSYSQQQGKTTHHKKQKKVKYERIYHELNSL